MFRSLLLSIIFFTGCSKVTYQTSLPQDAVHTHREMFFLYGLVGDAEIDLKEYCPFGVSSVLQQQDVVDMIIQYVTFGVVSPVSVEIRCAKKGSQADLPTVQEKFFAENPTNLFGGE